MSLFMQALAELGLPLPAGRDAVVVLARDIATQLVGGAVPPYDGAKRIWEISLRLPDEHLPELDTFVYGASEWEERPKDRDLFAQGILAAARHLVSG
jgi:hypothetical protein